MRLEQLELRCVYEDFNGDRWGVNPLSDKDKSNEIASFFGVPAYGGLTMYRILMVENAFYVWEIFRESPPSKFYIERVYVLARRGGNRL